MADAAEPDTHDAIRRVREVAARDPAVIQEIARVVMDVRATLAAVLDHKDHEGTAAARAREA